MIRNRRCVMQNTLIKKNTVTAAAIAVFMIFLAAIPLSGQNLLRETVT